MALKLAVSGKGGVGKSTLAGTISRLLAGDGRRVLAVDADPDANLAAALGIPGDLQKSIRTIALERDLVEERTGAKASEFGQIFSLAPDVTDIAEKYAVHYKGVDLLVMGAVSRAGGGCACPENVLLRTLVSHLVLKRREVVILDMEAGIEHLGRSTAMGVDLMLAVVEPGQRSVETAHRIREMSQGIGISGFGVVLNKSVDTDADTRWIQDEFGADALLGVIPFDLKIALADRTGRSIADSEDSALMEPFCKIARTVIERFEDTSLVAGR